MLSMRSTISSLGPAALALGVLACGGGGAGTPTSASSSTSGSSSSGGPGGAGTGGSTGTGGAGGQGTGGAAATEYDAIFVATLADPDLVKSQAAHDMVAMGAQAQAQALGDIAHFALLGTTILGTTQNQFMGLDRWDTDKMDMVYDNPMFQQALGSVFSPVPTIGKYKHEPAWASYGDIDTGKMYDPYFFVLIRGTLKDPATAQATHDAAVAAAKGKAMMAGDVAHTVYLGRDDATQVAFVDIWKDSTNIMAVYTDPGFQAAFGMVFAAQPEIGVYQSTSWYQW